ncbi:MAG: hypothetical protein KGL02_11805, partial [Acidobacteriota bacterium]|nr:hypothetical protein [Acidobacteriota bacterium]
MPQPRGFGVILAFLFVLPCCVAAQSPPPTDANNIAQIKSLYDSRRYDAVVDAVPESPNEPADLELYRGLALAQLQRWDEAKSAFQTGLVLHPRDARLMVELAGVLYRQKNFAQAKHFLRHALSIEPGDAYSNDFLGSIYFLEGNLEAALQYWNRAGKPRLADLSYVPEPAIDPLILDRAFSFARGEVWTRGQYLSTEARLGALDLFPLMQFDLQPQVPAPSAGAGSKDKTSDGSFNLVFRAQQRAPWTRNYLVGAFTFLRGLPFESVYPEFYDLDGAGLNSRSMLRWDDQKRRLTTELAAPLFDNPALRYRLYFDARDENWNITQTLLPASPANARFNLERIAAGAELHLIESGRGRWS